MFSSNLGDEILPSATEETSVQACATRDSKTGMIFLKAVNPNANSEPLKIQIQGVKRIDNKGSVITLAGNPEDLNSITEPRKIIPVTDSLRDVSSTFSYTLPGHSVVVLKLKAR
jgi:alpha-N-arabinofuranosidase